MKILMRNVGMTLHVIHKLRAQGIDNVKVNMDWQHLIMNGENLAEYAALLAAEGLLGHQHANSGWGTFDDDNMVGATAFMETLELALELRRAGYGDERRAARLRPLPVHRGRGRARSSARVLQWRFIDERRGEDRRGGAARGAAREGRRARVRARVRRAGAWDRRSRGRSPRLGAMRSRTGVGRARRLEKPAVLAAWRARIALIDTSDAYGPSQRAADRRGAIRTPRGS